MWSMAPAPGWETLKRVNEDAKRAGDIPRPYLFHLQSKPRCLAEGVDVAGLRTFLALDDVE